MDKDKLRMQTPDGAQRNVEKIRALFPHCVVESRDAEGRTELKVDFEQLQACLAPDLANEDNLRYRFTWPDKHRAFWLGGRPIRRALRPCRAESVDFDTTRNLYIEGDNLEVLKCLQETYLGRVKMIYIDPPYNTGHDFVYRDDYRMGREEYEDASGQRDAEGNRLTLNAESSGRFHTDWLNMMYPRLLLAQSLLREDGVIFISIDDHEVANLRKMCDEVFGEGNFVAQLVWSAGRKNDSKHVSLSHEYVVCYFRNSLQIKERSIVWREKKEGLADIYEKYEQLKKEFKEDIEAIELGMKRWFKSLQDGNPAKNHRHYSRVDSRGLFFADNISWPGGGGPKYEVLHPVTGKPVKVPSRGWITDQKTMMQWIAEDRVFFGPDENRVPTIKAYLTDRESSVPYSVLYKDGRAASKRLATLMGDKVFENPKDEQVIQRLLEWNQLSEGDIVLDFFSGSASVAHACMLSNVAREDMGIRFVMVQIQEPITTKGKTGSQLKVAENALKLCNTLGVSATICEIGKERIRRAGAKLREEYPEAEVDTGFRVLKLDSSNMQDVYYQPSGERGESLLAGVDTVKPDRTQEDLLFQTMLELGIPLDERIVRVEVEGNTLFNVGEAFLVACFDGQLGEAALARMVELQPDYVVIRDAGGGDDTALVNCRAVLRERSSRTNLRIL